MSADSYDGPWKDVLDVYFPDFLGFFFPHVYDDVDWTRGWESLDQELRKVVRDAVTGTRLADKLMRVWRLDGSENLVLVHVEVQGERDDDFGERMFVSNYRIYDRYRRPVASLAVLGDDSPSWRPEEFGWDLWECETGIRYPVVKLRDYNDHWVKLEESHNPFATVVMAHLQTRQTRRDPARRLEWKTRLMRRLYRYGYLRRDVVALFRFIDWVMRLPDALEDEFERDLEEIEEEFRMPYISRFERRKMQQGLERGLEQGLERGRYEGELEIVTRQLKRRYASLPTWAEERLAKATTSDLERWSERILDAERLEDVFADGSCQHPRKAPP